MCVSLVLWFKLLSLMYMKDMSTFASQCSASALRRLRTITLTIQQQTSLKEWITDVTNLLEKSPLELFQIYSIGGFLDSTKADDLWGPIVRSHREHLTRFSIHRMRISMAAIQTICTECTSLQELFVVVDPDSMVIYALL